MRLILAAILVSAGCAQFERYEVGADDPVVIRVDVAEVATLDAPAADVALADAAVEVIATDAAASIDGAPEASADASAETSSDATPADVLTPLQRCQANCYRSGYRCLQSDGGAVVACCWHLPTCSGSSLCQSLPQSCGGPGMALGNEECCRVY